MEDKIENQINVYMHCRQCLLEKPNDVSPLEWSRTQTGLTPSGEVQVWCNRHDINVALLSPQEVQYFTNAACQGGPH